MIFMQTGLIRQSGSHLVMGYDKNRILVCQVREESQNAVQSGLMSLREARLRGGSLSINTCHGKNPAKRRLQGPSEDKTQGSRFTPREAGAGEEM